MEKGIYVLANDAVFDQLVALLNSIEVNYSRAIPVCAIPYDDNLERVRAEIAKRPQVRLFEDGESIKNLALSIPREKRTGNSVTSTHFEAVAGRCRSME